MEYHRLKQEEGEQKMEHEWNINGILIECQWMLMESRVLMECEWIMNGIWLKTPSFFKRHGQSTRDLLRGCSQQNRRVNPSSFGGQRFKISLW